MFGSFGQTLWITRAWRTVAVAGDDARGLGLDGAVRLIAQDPIDAAVLVVVGRLAGGGAFVAPALRRGWEDEQCGRNETVQVKVSARSLPPMHPSRPSGGKTNNAREAKRCM